MRFIRFLRTSTFSVTLLLLQILIGNANVDAADGKKLALIIGNGDYAVNPITTAVNDAGQIAATLKKLGYSIALRENLDRGRMLKTVAAYEKALAGADTGLFIYVGHGVQYQKVNYLVPLGAAVESDWQIKETCVGLNDVAERVARSGVKTGVFMIDATRPNPLGTRFSPPQSGLAEMTAPDNLHIILADAPNRLTRQGVDPLPDADGISGFTSTLVALLKEVPDLSIGQFMRQLQLAVSVKSRRERNPWFLLGKNDSISIYDSQALFAKKLETWPRDSSVDQARALMAEALDVPGTPVVDDQITGPKNPWTDNPILIFHTVLRDLEKLYDVEQASLPDDFYRAGMSLLKAKYSNLVENEADIWTPEILLKSALTRTWPWSDPFLSPELAAKTAAAEAAKEAEALSEETDLDEKEKAVSTPEPLPEDEAEPLETTGMDPVKMINPAIPQLKASLILTRHKAMLQRSRLPGTVKRTALTAADDYARELKLTTASPIALFERAMSIYHQQGRRALVISDGKIDQATAAFIQALEESGFMVTKTTMPDQWPKEIASLNEKLTPDDVGLIYATSDRIALNDLMGAMETSTNALNIIIRDPALSLNRPGHPIETVKTLPAKTAVLLADTPTTVKESEDAPKKPLPEDDAEPFTLPEGPVMARALASYLDKPSQTLTALFQNVQRNVATVTKNHRNPWWIFGSEAISTPFRFNDSTQKFSHLLAQLDIFRYLEATDAAPELFDLGWEALVQDHPDWTWFVEKGDFGAVLKRALASDSADERHIIALKQGLLPRFTNDQGITFIYQPKGDFLMGSFTDEAGRTGDEAIAEKSINSGYYLMQTEVTQAQWQAVMEQNLASFDECGPDCPMETVSWYDAQVFIKRLNGSDLPEADLLPAAFQRRWREQVDQNPWHVFADELDRYLNQVGRGDFLYRLPTEVEWEFACRSGRQTWFGYGSELWRLPEYAWYNENAPKSPQPVASKRANESGLYDLHGNVWEWCMDGQGRFKTVRGGSWYYDGLAARCAKRYYLKPNEANYNVGLRLVAIPVASR